MHFQGEIIHFFLKNKALRSKSVNYFLRIKIKNSGNEMEGIVGFLVILQYNTSIFVLTIAMAIYL